MSLIQVRSDRYLRIQDTLPVTVKNLGTSPVFFSAQQGISSAVKDGEIAEGATTEVTVPTYFLVEPPAGKGTNIVGTREQTLEVTRSGVQLDVLPPLSVQTGDLAALSVTTAKIAAEAVTEPKLGAAAVSSGKVLASTLPVAGAEKSVVVATAGVGRKITAVHVGDGAEVKIKVKHSFGTEAVQVTVQKGAETKKPGEGYLNAAGAGNFTWTPINVNEVEITFGTAPIAKFESFVTVVG